MIAWLRRSEGTYSLRYLLHTHITPTHMYLWSVLGEAPVCLDCKHLNAEPGQVGRDRSKVTGLIPVPRAEANVKTAVYFALGGGRSSITGACGIDGLNLRVE